MFRSTALCTTCTGTGGRSAARHVVSHAPGVRQHGVDVALVPREQRAREAPAADILVHVPDDRRIPGRTRPHDVRLEPVGMKDGGTAGPDDGAQSMEVGRKRERHRHEAGGQRDGAGTGLTQASE